MRGTKDNEIQWCCATHQGYGCFAVDWFDTEEAALRYAKQASSLGNRFVYVLRCKWQADTAAEIADVEAT